MSVTALSFDNLVEIVAVMSDAFRDYPVMRWTLGADTPGGAPFSVRLHRLVQLFVSGRAYRDEPMMGVRDERGVLVAAAVASLAPTVDPPPAFIALRESIWAELGADARGRYDAYAAAGTAFFDGLGPHHHLNMIGVRRTHQGLGLGRELLAAVQKLAATDPQSAGVSLTTELAENVKLYEHFGYRVVGHRRVGAGFETWGMFRERSV